MLATFAELLDVDLPDKAGEDSQSFAPVLVDPNADYDRVPFVSHDSRDMRYAITDGIWKLVLPSGKKSAELYNLSKDRAEATNVADANPEKVQALTEKMNALITKGRSTQGESQSNDTGYWKDLTWMTKQQYSELAK